MELLKTFDLEAPTVLVWKLESVGQGSGTSVEPCDLLYHSPVSLNFLNLLFSLYGRLPLGRLIGPMPEASDWTIMLYPSMPLMRILH